MTPHHAGSQEMLLSLILGLRPPRAFPASPTASNTGKRNRSNSTCRLPLPAQTWLAINGKDEGKAGNDKPPADIRSLMLLISSYGSGRRTEESGVMKNVHSWRHLKFRGINNANGMNTGRDYEGVYPVRNRRSYGVNVNPDNNLPILWRFSACPTPSVYNKKMNTFATKGYFL
jgi:hypothetical protein